jgi:hypothetical protein
MRQVDANFASFVKILKMENYKGLNFKAEETANKHISQLGRGHSTKGCR